MRINFILQGTVIYIACVIFLHRFGDLLSELPENTSSQVADLACPTSAVSSSVEFDQGNVLLA